MLLKICCILAYYVTIFYQGLQRLNLPHDWRPVNARATQSSVLHGWCFFWGGGLTPHFSWPPFRKYLKPLEFHFTPWCTLVWHFKNVSKMAYCMACNMDCMASKPGILLLSSSQYFCNLDIILCCSSNTCFTRFSLGSLGLGANFLCGTDCMLSQLLTPWMKGVQNSGITIPYHGQTVNLTAKMSLWNSPCTHITYTHIYIWLLRKFYVWSWFSNLLPTFLYASSKLCTVCQLEFWWVVVSLLQSGNYIYKFQNSTGNGCNWEEFINFTGFPAGIEVSNHGQPSYDQTRDKQSLPVYSSRIIVWVAIIALENRH